MTSWRDQNLILEVLIVNLGDSALLLPLLFKSVTTSLVTWSSGNDVFFYISNPVSKNVKRYLKT